MSRDRTRLRTIVSGITLAAIALAGCSDKGGPNGVPDGDVPPAFAPASDCQGCHPDQFAEWVMSRHAYSGVDPLMERLSEVAGPTVAPVCRACHAPAQRRLDLLREAGLDAPAGDLFEDGINCDVCHTISEIPPVASIDFFDDIDPTGPKYANMADPVDTPAHANARREWYGTSIACASCHQFNTGDGTPLENTFIEWEATHLAGMGIECQDCHMPTYTGRAAVGAPVRENLHRHRFVGVDYTYEPFRGIDLALQKQWVKELLENSVSVDVVDLPASVAAGDTLRFGIRVTNDRTGHSIPSGVSFAREMWIEVTVKDAGAGGAVLYRSGYLDADDDLVLPPADPDLARFWSQMYDAQGEPTGFAWLAASIDETGMLKYLESRTARYAPRVPTTVVGPLELELALRFRSLGPGGLRALGLERILPIEIFDMWRDTDQVAVTVR